MFENTGKRISYFLKDGAKTIKSNQSFTGISDVLRTRGATHPERTAFVFLDRKCQESSRLSYGRLDEQVDAVASAIVGYDLVGEPVLLVFDPGPEFVIAFFACLRAGAIAVPMPVGGGRRTEDRVAAICIDARPHGILTMSYQILPDEAYAILQGCERIPTRIDIDRIPKTSARPIFDEVHSDDLAFLQYTSGSTSTPKGVMLTHGNIMANNAMIAAAFGHDETTRGVGWLPLFHDMGLIGHVIQPVFVGCMSVLMSPLTFLQRPIRWLEAISEWRATHSGGPSHGYALCLRQKTTIPDGLDLSSWRMAYCGSEPVRGAILDSFGERFAPYGFNTKAFLPCYGLAEATLLATSRPRGEGVICAGADRRHAISCGRPWEGGSIAIVDVDTGHPVREGDVGEIRVAGPHVALGYWQKDQESRVFAGDMNGRSVRTGDRGYLDKGELYVLGRLKDIIIIMGVNHSAEDVEAAALTAHASFAGQMAAAFGIDGDNGEQAVIVHEVPGSSPSEEMRRSMEASATAVVHQLGIRLADVVLVKSGTLPRTSSGKIQRGRVRTLYASGELKRLETSQQGHVAP